MPAPTKPSTLGGLARQPGRQSSKAPLPPYVVVGGQELDAAVVDHAASMVATHAKADALGALVLHVLRRQASTGVLYSGRSFLAARALELGLEEGDTATSAGDLLKILSSGAKQALEAATISAFALRGLLAELGAGLPDPEALEHFFALCDWLELRSPYRIYALVDAVLGDANADPFWAKLGAGLDARSATPSPASAAIVALRRAALQRSRGPAGTTAAELPATSTSTPAAPRVARSSSVDDRGFRASLGVAPPPAAWVIEQPSRPSAVVQVERAGLWKASAKAAFADDSAPKRPAAEASAQPRPAEATPQPAPAGSSPPQDIAPAAAAAVEPAGTVLAQRPLAQGPAASPAMDSGTEERALQESPQQAQPPQAGEPAAAPPEAEQLAAPKQERGKRKKGKKHGKRRKKDRRAARRNPAPAPQAKSAVPPKSASSAPAQAAQPAQRSPSPRAPAESSQAQEVPPLTGRLGRPPAEAWRTTLRLLTGWALVTGLGRALLWCLGHRRQAVLTLQAGALSSQVDTHLLGRVVRRRHELWPLRSLHSIVEEVRHPTFWPLVGALTLALCALGGALIFVDGLRGAEPWLLVGGASLIAGGAAADLLLEAFLPRSRGRHVVVLRTIAKGALRLEAAEPQAARAFGKATTEALLHAR